MQSRRRTATKGRNCSWQPPEEPEKRYEHPVSEGSSGRRVAAAYGPLVFLTFIGFFVVPKLAPILGIPTRDQRSAALRLSSPAAAIQEDQSRSVSLQPSEKSAQSASQTTEPSTVPQGFPNQHPEEIAAAVPLDQITGRLESLTNDFTTAGSTLRQLLVRRWAEADPSAALAWATARPDSPDALPVLKQAAVVWANTNLPAAMDWVRDLPAGTMRQGASIAVAFEAARSDPVQALNLAIPLPQSAQRDELLIYGMRQYAAREPEAASQWALQVEDPSLRNRLLEAVGTAASETDPSSAANLVSSSMSPGADQNRAAVSIIQRWAQVSPEAASAWVNLFPVGGVRTDAVQNLVAIWSRQNRDAARSWLTTLPEGRPLASAAP